MNNLEFKILKEIKQGNFESSYDLLILNRSFLRGLYNKLHIAGYYYEEFEIIAWEALIKAAKNADISKLEYFNGYWKKYILHEYLSEKLQIQYKFSLTISEYSKLKNADKDPIEDFYNKMSPYEGLIIDDNYEDLYHSDLRKVLWAYVQDALTDENAYIIWELFENGRTQISLAKEFGIGAERIRRRKVRSLEKLKNDKNIQALARDYYNIQI